MEESDTTSEKKNKPEASRIPTPPKKDGKIDFARKIQPIPEKMVSFERLGKKSLIKMKN